MVDSLTSTSVYLMPGMALKISCPVSTKNANGYFAMTDKPPASYFPNKPSGADLTLERGFIVEDTNVGTIAPSSESALAVIYTHKKPASNAIWFFAKTGETAIINIITVPIHDHSTIVHGGPAYGSYFDDDLER